ncbi:X-ray repair cross complementing 2 [Striga asiatica]|uniref:X-ray repair cross complementing 2 n=1 Tax=Striga asiatica TaxID=4170 RepID=A0A5A7PET3_STRAF|nr:X-ray repair cross complementing 2 [Striga asiatica]
MNPPSNVRVGAGAGPEPNSWKVPRNIFPSKSLKIIVIFKHVLLIDRIAEARHVLIVRCRGVARGGSVDAGQGELRWRQLRWGPLERRYSGLRVGQFGLESYNLDWKDPHMTKAQNG